MINAVEDGSVKLTTNKQKGNYGEMKMDDYFESQGYSRVSTGRVTSLDDKIVKGIDGVYENASPPPKFVIGEAKYGTSQLSNTQHGKQMSEQWISGNQRLEKSVGTKLADAIREEQYLNPENVKKVLIKIETDGTVTETVLDSAAKVMKK